MIDENKRVGPEGVILLTHAGLFSGLITICISYTNVGFPAQFLLGVPFGMLISGCLVGLGILRDSGRVIRLILVATVAYFLSFLGAYLLQGLVLSIFMTSSEKLAPSPIALSFGGIIGAFLIFSEAVFLPRSETKKRAFQRAILWSWLGGVLGAIGGELGPTLGATLLSFVHALHLASLTALPEDRFNRLEMIRPLYSLYLVWQTGMALAVGLMLQRYDAKPRGRKLEQQ